MTCNPSTVTLNELIKMEDQLGDYTKGLRNRQGGQDRSWRLFSLTAAHGCPSTHEEAVPNAETLARSLLGDETLVITGVPRLHYAEAGTRGVSRNFTAAFQGGSYHPGNFGDRTKLGPKWTLVCAGHRTDYDRCNRCCRVGVQLDGRFLIDIVRM